MAWRSSGATNTELVNNLRRNNIAATDYVRDVMLTVDRAFFVKDNPYDDRPQSIGFSATISAPHMHAYSLSLLEPNLKPGACALDVGSGSGILTACFALMVGTTGTAVGIEHIDELHKLSEVNIRNWLFNGTDVDLELGKQIQLVTGDGRNGYAPCAPYDAIHVGAAAPTLPQALIDQLKPGGRMICPVGPEGGQQNLVQVDKAANGKITQKDLMGVMYIPLTDYKHQTRSWR
ncbi:unnamed protein product [Schistocephalus solidus]|uniref:Protein-L-isoaspartate O-methyltransferase n=1 Tax=Schistocephalus solidus TaxID=70667 RepID=A0A183SIQ7_SCHSO|nr:unnamed protein product [Schistocephalus solidus]